jgi:hypothetical protein
MSKVMEDNLLDSRLIFRAAESGRRHGDIDALRRRKGG